MVLPILPVWTEAPRSASVAPTLARDDRQQLTCTEPLL